LRDSLALNDSMRPSVTLRLADLVFDEATIQGSRVDLDAPAENRLIRLRRQAVSLYQEILNGTKFAPPAQGAQAIKIKFQLARLAGDLGELARASSLWDELVAQTEVREIRREAAFRVAERYENQASRLKDAERYYRLALELCDQGDTCAFAQYRLG